MLISDLVALQNCMDLVKSEPGSYSDSSVASDDYDENWVINIKVEKDIDVEVKQNPVAITFTAIKSEHEVSFVFIHHSSIFIDI